MRQILKQKNQWCLVKYSETAHFKKGRACLHTRVQYCIEHSTQFDPACEEPIETGCFWIQTKSEALKIFNELIKTHVLNGHKLNEALFIEGV